MLDTHCARQAIHRAPDRCSFRRASKCGLVLLVAAAACLDLTNARRGVPQTSPSYPAYLAIQAGASFTLPAGLNVAASGVTGPAGVAEVTAPQTGSSLVITAIRRGFAEWDPGAEGLHPVHIAVLGERRTAPILVGHHGVPSLAPENTLAGTRAACELGLPGIEVDVRLSKDSVPVLMHDRDVRRTSNGTGYVDAMTFADLAQLDVGSWFSPSFAGERVPTLTDFLSLSALCGFDHIQLDMKTFVPVGVDSGMVRVGRTVEAAGLLDRVFVASDLYSLRRGVSLVAHMRTLVYGGVISSSYADALIQNRIEGVAVFFGDYAASASQLTRLEAAGILVGVWSPPGVLDLNGLTPVPRFVTSNWPWRFVN